MSNGRILTPQPTLSVTFHDKPNAHPVGLAIPSPNGLEFHVFGGLSDLETMAGMIGGRIAVDGAASTAQWATAVVDAAQAILDECAKRQKPEAT